MRRNALWIGLAALAVVVMAGLAGVYLSDAAGRNAAPQQGTTLQPTLTPTVKPAQTSLPDVAQGRDQGQVPNSRQGSEFVQLVAEDADLFNPALTNTDTGVTVLGLIYPRLVGRDSQTGVITPTELATGWDISPDGRVYTFTLHNDVFWSDGQPVTAADFRYTYEALSSAPVPSPVQDRLDDIVQIETPDTHTVVLRLEEPDCAVLHSLRLPLLPSHRYAPDYADLASNPLNTSPEVSAGPFRFVEWTPGKRIVLERNPDYWKGAPQIERFVLRVEPDAAARLRMIANGDADLMRHSAAELAEAERDLSPQVRVYTYPAPALQFLALNLGNPQNPQPGRDSTGNLIAQEPHPVLGDSAVRRAIALGFDYEAIMADEALMANERLISEAYGGQGYVPATGVLSTIPWAHAAALTPRSYRPEEAVAALENAGWADADGDGVRENAGVRLALTLLTNQENTARVQAADLIAAQLGELGFEITRLSEPFGDLAATVLAQRYDMALMGWENLPPDPGVMPLWRSDDDLPGSGANFTSFQDAEVDAWLAEAVEVPGCGLEERGELYRRVQRRVHDSLPYVFVHGETAGWTVNSRWTGLAPGPWGRGDNVHEWR